MIVGIISKDKVKMAVGKNGCVIKYEYYRPSKIKKFFRKIIKMIY